MREDFINSLCAQYDKYNVIDDNDFEKYSVKRGLRNDDGTGVLVGLTNICTVHGYIIYENEKRPDDGRLVYRGINIVDLVQNAMKEDRYCFEETVYLLLIGCLPTASQLSQFNKFLGSNYELPEHFTRNVINNSPSPNVMNKLAQAVLALYAYDENPEDNSVEGVLRHSLELIAMLPQIIINSYSAKKRSFDKASVHFHFPDPNLSIAESFLYMLRPDHSYTKEEAKLLDICLMVHAEHSGGNNSTFTTRVLSSSSTDTFSVISSAMSSLKGARHGGANAKVNAMIDDIKANAGDYCDEKTLIAYLEKIINREAGDKSGLIYGMGHAVYTTSDPRAILLKERAKALAEQKGMQKDYQLIENIERLTPLVFEKQKGGKKPICANVDLYSGFVYRMLGIDDDLHTALFAMARTPGWCAHRIEEIVTGKRIIRPAYKSVNPGQDYLPLNERD